MAIFGLIVTNISRSNKKSEKENALAMVKYITKESDDKISDIYFGNLPKFAKGDPATFFNAVDKRERKNGTLCRCIIGLIPIELNKDQAIALVKKFIKEVIDERGFPFVVAFHNLGEHNPHFHAIFSERQALNSLNKLNSLDKKKRFILPPRQRKESGKRRCTESHDWQGTVEMAKGHYNTMGKSYQ